MILIGSQIEKLINFLENRIKELESFEMPDQSTKFKTFNKFVTMTATIHFMFAYNSLRM